MGLEPGGVFLSPLKIIMMPLLVFLAFVETKGLPGTEGLLPDLNLALGLPYCCKHRGVSLPLCD